MPEKLLTKPIKKLMQEALEENVFPGAALMVSRDGVPLFCDVFGIADIYTEEKVEIDTVFDLASLTKPLATTLAVMKLVEEQHLDLDGSISNYIHEFKNTDKKDICLRHLLCHTSGLVDYIPFYKEISGDTIAERKTRLRKLLLNAPLKHPVGRTVLYSDLGFMILNWIIEQETQQAMDRFLAEELYGPMGIDRDGLFFNAIENSIKPGKYAATEFCPWRKRCIKGNVHDENAYCVGGIEGHAGLFGTLYATHDLLLKLVAMYHGKVQRPRLLPRTMQQFLTEQDHLHRTLGFDMPSEKDSSAGKYFSRKGVGHLGFTGTSFWMDLERSIIVVLLTNRIHPTRENTKIKSFRPKLHDRVMEMIL